MKRKGSGIQSSTFWSLPVQLNTLYSQRHYQHDFQSVGNPTWYKRSIRNIRIYSRHLFIQSYMTIYINMRCFKNIGPYILFPW